MCHLLTPFISLIEEQLCGIFPALSHQIGQVLFTAQLHESHFRLVFRLVLLFFFGILILLSIAENIVLNFAISTSCS
jgi:hypothetical protein